MQFASPIMSKVQRISICNAGAACSGCGWCRMQTFDVTLYAWDSAVTALLIHVRPRARAFLASDELCCAVKAGM